MVENGKSRTPSHTVHTCLLHLGSGVEVTQERRAWLGRPPPRSRQQQAGGGGARCRPPPGASSIALAAWDNGKKLSRHCQGSPGGSGHPRPLQEPSLHEITKRNHLGQGGAGQDSNNKGLATKLGHLPPSMWWHAGVENLVSRRHTSNSRSL